jgi:hypothetical protein
LTLSSESSRITIRRNESCRGRGRCRRCRCYRYGAASAGQKQIRSGRVRMRRNEGCAPARSPLQAAVAVVATRPPPPSTVAIQARDLRLTIPCLYCHCCCRCHHRFGKGWPDRFGAGVHDHIHAACVGHGGVPQRAAAPNCRRKGARAARAARVADGGAAFQVGAGVALLGATGVMSGQLACAAQRSRWRCRLSSHCASGPIPSSPGLPSPITCPFRPPPSLLEKPGLQIRLTTIIDNWKVEENVGFIIFITLRALCRSPSVCGGLASADSPAMT